MGLRIPSIKRAAKTISKGLEVPKGYLTVYVGDNMRQFLKKKYGYDHPMGDLTILCSEDKFLRINSRLNEIELSLALSIPYILQEKWGKASFSAKQAISKSVQVPKELSEVEEEFGYDHLMGGGYHLIPWEVSIPCSEHVFHQLASPLS
ncbi:hypothetical protein Ahy_B03g067170 [Arachis hypogaea]|uniref:Auxin-induced protein n=1 Tax=Arachis hypogaea TaxID=3818 RepID=A0A445A678_ARAHY|nr:hypothetical protein Ahy_B03g067170 [Arachis hypogaea]